MNNKKRAFFLMLFSLTAIFLSILVSAGFGYDWVGGSSGGGIVTQYVTTGLNNNNSDYLNGHNSYYFYPYSNPLGFIDNGVGDLTNYYTITIIDGKSPAWLSTYNSSYYLNSNPYGFYNVTTLPVSGTDNSSYATWLSVMNNISAWTTTYNSTYDTWLGNYTASNKFWYNMTYSGSTYNSTYNQWAYNQTYSGSTYNASYHGTLNNESYLSTYNSTYDAKNSSQWLTSNGNISYVGGNVGIGTTAPNQKLDVNGSVWLKKDNDKLYLGDARDASITYNGSQTLFTNEVGSGAWTFGSGNVGIGTTNPGQALDVNGSVNVANNIILNNAFPIVGYTDPTKRTLFGGYTSSPQGAYMQMFGKNFSALNGGDAEFTIDATGLKANSAFTVFSYGYGGGTSYVGRLRVQADGNVGIGTTAPTQTLNVVGTLNATGATNLGGGLAGRAICWKTNSLLSYCSSIVGADGSCTCV